MKRKVILILLALTLVLSACSETDPKKSIRTTAEEKIKDKLKEEVEKTEEKAKDKVNKEIAEAKEGIKRAEEKIKSASDKLKSKVNEKRDGLKTNPRPVEEKTVELESLEEQYFVWDEKLAPNYYLVTGPANVSRPAEEDRVNYGKLDNLGRPTWASILITDETMEKEANEERQSITVNPKGWPIYNPKVELNHPDGTTYKGYLFNRSHMIADSLGGDAVYENLVTGTRPQNVGARSNNGGMAYLESKIRNQFATRKGITVAYTVENFYKGSESIPRYSVVNAFANDGSIDERVIVFNVAPGIEFSYTNAKVKGYGPDVKDQRDIPVIKGAKKSRGILPAPKPKQKQNLVPKPAPIPAPREESNKDQTYVGNANSRVFHSASCGSVGQMKEHNKVSLNSKADAIDQGFKPCGRCNPYDIIKTVIKN